jgi:hypothetical protein
MAVKRCRAIIDTATVSFPMTPPMLHEKYVVEKPTVRNSMHTQTNFLVSLRTMILVVEKNSDRRSEDARACEYVPA